MDDRSPPIIPLTPVPFTASPSVVNLKNFQHSALAGQMYDTLTDEVFGKPIVDTIAISAPRIKPTVPAPNPAIRLANIIKRGHDWLITLKDGSTRKLRPLDILETCPSCHSDPIKWSDIRNKRQAKRTESLRCNRQAKGKCDHLPAKRRSTNRKRRREEEVVKTVDTAGLSGLNNVSIGLLHSALVGQNISSKASKPSKSDDLLRKAIFPVLAALEPASVVRLLVDVLLSHQEKAKAESGQKSSTPNSEMHSQDPTDTRHVKINEHGSVQILLQPPPGHKSYEKTENRSQFDRTVEYSQPKRKKYTPEAQQHRLDDFPNTANSYLYTNPLPPGKSTHTQPENLAHQKPPSRSYATPVFNQQIQQRVQLQTPSENPATEKFPSINRTPIVPSSQEIHAVSTSKNTSSKPYRNAFTSDKAGLPAVGETEYENLDETFFKIKCLHCSSYVNCVDNFCSNCGKRQTSIANSQNEPAATTEDTAYKIPPTSQSPHTVSSPKVNAQELFANFEGVSGFGMALF